MSQGEFTIERDNSVKIRWRKKGLLGIEGPHGFEIMRWEDKQLLELAGLLLDEVHPHRRHAMLIAGQVAREFETTLADIFSRNRDRETADARHVCIVLFREHHGNVKDRVIASYFNRERSLVPYAFGQFQSLIETDVTFRTKVNRIRAKVRKILWPQLDKAS